MYSRKLLNRSLGFPRSKNKLDLGSFYKSAILVDLGDKTHDVTVNNAASSRTVELLRFFEILDAERLQRLETAWFGELITQDEAQADNSSGRF